MRSFLIPSREATNNQLAVTGASGGGGIDPIDGDIGFRQVGVGTREIPGTTLEKARTFSIASYRVNPMARAIIDTYGAFCVGDSGVNLQCTSREVEEHARKFWDDPRNRVGALQDPMLRDHLLMGESAYEMMVGATTGVTRFSPIDPMRITGVDLDRGNPLWPKTLHVRMANTSEPFAIVQPDDITGLRTGEVMFWSSFKALLTDRRGFPFLGPIIDWLDSYDSVLQNLIDRTALARYLTLDVTLTGADQNEIDEWVRIRGGLHAPRSGTVEVHNEQVAWEVKTADVGSFEDTNTAKSILTQIAGGAGLAKTWLAEPEDANRATSISMAEPVRRRVAGIQKIWFDYQTDFVRYAVDQAVAAGRLDALVEINSANGDTQRVTPASTISVTGPEVAAADAQITAEVLVSLATALDLMVSKNLMTREAAAEATKKGWEDFMGVPYKPELGEPDANVDDVATHVDDKTKTAPAPLRAV